MDRATKYRVITKNSPRGRKLHFGHNFGRCDETYEEGCGAVRKYRENQGQFVVGVWPTYDTIQE